MVYNIHDFKRDEKKIKTMMNWILCNLEEESLQLDVSKRQAFDNVIDHLDDEINACKHFERMGKNIEETDYEDFLIMKAMVNAMKTYMVK